MSLRILLCAWTQRQEVENRYGEAVDPRSTHKDEQPNGSFGRLSIHIER